MATPVVELYTTLKNPLGISRNYSYLPPHGKVIPAGGTITIHGDIRTHPLIVTDIRKKLALERDLGASPPNLKIISTPPPILADTVGGADKKLVLTSGALGIATPGWG